MEYRQTQKRSQQPSPASEWFFTICLGVYALGMLAFGIFMLRSRNDVMVLALAVVTAPLAAWLAWEHVRQYRRGLGRHRPR